MKKILILLLLLTSYFIHSQDIKYIKKTWCIQEINNTTYDMSVIFLYINGHKAFKLGDDIYQYDSIIALTRHEHEYTQIKTHYVNGSDYSSFQVECIVSKEDGFIKIEFYRNIRMYEYLIDASGDITGKPGGVIRIFTGKEPMKIAAYYIREVDFL